MRGSVGLAFHVVLRLLRLLAHAANLIEYLTSLGLALVGLQPDDLAGLNAARVMSASLLASGSMLAASLLDASALMELDGVSVLPVDLQFHQLLVGRGWILHPCHRAFLQDRFTEVPVAMARLDHQVLALRLGRVGDVGFASDTMPSELAGMPIALSDIAAQLSIVEVRIMLDAASCVTVGDSPSMSLLIML